VSNQPSTEKVIDFASTLGTETSDARLRREIGEQESVICDSRFMRDLEQLKVRSFLIQHALSVKTKGAMDFSGLNTLRLGSRGRYPREDEWKRFEEYTEALYRDLDDDVRRKFLYGQIPGWVTKTAIILGGAALVALAVAVILLPYIYRNVSVYVLPLYMIWVAALGSIGSISFIGMNALAVQADVTFDLTNTKLIVMRVVLGALFGVVLTLPFGYGSFVRFLYQLRSGGAEISSGTVLQSVLLLLPFILGFSTSLVIMILNQFVEAVQIFFGKNSSAKSAQPTAAPQSPPSGRAGSE
jgi:hypothetical protein